MNESHETLLRGLVFVVIGTKLKITDTISGERDKFGRCQVNVKTNLNINI